MYSSLSQSCSCHSYCQHGAHRKALLRDDSTGGIVLYMKTLMKTISIENGPPETLLGACPLGLAYVVSMCLVFNLHNSLTHIDNSHAGLPSHIHLRSYWRAGLQKRVCHDIVSGWVGRNEKAREAWLASSNPCTRDASATMRAWCSYQAYEA